MDRYAARHYIDRQMLVFFFVGFGGAVDLAHDEHCIAGPGLAQDDEYFVAAHVRPARCCHEPFSLHGASCALDEVA